MPPVGGLTRVVHVISTADTGGAEVMLAGLVGAHRGLGLESHIVVLGNQGPMSERYASVAASVAYLGINRGSTPSVRQCVRLWGVVRRVRPHALHGWMPHGMFAAWVARLACPGRCALVWGVHQTLYSLQEERPLTSTLVRVLARLSPRADSIAYVSHVSREQHEALGFDRQRGVLVDNSVDTARYSPNESARAEQRRLLGVPEQGVVVGYIGRNHPQKDIETLLGALDRVLTAMPNAHAVVVGSGLDEKGIGPPIPGALAARFRLLGRRDDVDQVIHAFDVLVLSSAYGEAAPTVVLEAMACGIPSVVTDVGDSARLVGELGAVVPSRDSSALAEAVTRVMEVPEALRRMRSAELREIATRRYSMEGMARSYAALYRTGAPPSV